MYVTLLFWFALALPGYALVRRAWPERDDSGLLGTLALSYLAALGLLVPVNIASYLLAWPVDVFAVSACVLILAGIIDISSQHGWKDAWHVVRGSLRLELVLLLVLLAADARNGSQLGSDAQQHVARIRHLIHADVNNSNPFVNQSGLYAFYHTNIWHLLMASASVVARQDVVSVWFVSLAFGKLLLVAGAYFASWCVFERRWAAWMSAMAFVGLFGLTDIACYPNKIAPFFLNCMMLGLCIRAAGRPSWSVFVAILVSSLLLGQVHSLYLVYALLVIAPVLALTALVQCMRRSSGCVVMVASVLAMFAGLPFPAISASAVMYSSSPESDQPPGAAAEGAPEARAGRGTSRVQAPDSDEAEHARRERWEASVAAGKADAEEGGRLVSVAGGLSAVNPLSGFGSRSGLRYWLLGAGVVIALLTRGRWRALFLAAVLVMVGVVLFVPWVADPILRKVSEPFMVLRLEGFFWIGLIVLLPGSVAALIERLTFHGVVRALLSVGVAALAIEHQDSRTGTEWHAWNNYGPAALRPAQDRLDYLQELRDLGAFLAAHVPPGSTIVAVGDVGALACMVHDVYLVTPPPRGDAGISDKALRRSDTIRILSRWTPEKVRVRRMQRWDVEFLLYDKLNANLSNLIAETHQHDDWTLARLKPLEKLYPRPR